jgi:signal transduction histidine kinase
VSADPSVESILRTVPLFAELADAELARIAATATLQNVPAGTCIMAEGSAPAAMFVIVDGEFAVTKRGPAGPIAINMCGPGDLLGELSVLEGRPRTASVTASQDSRVVVLAVDALHELLRSSLSATLAILRTMASRLGNTESVLRQHDTLASLGRIAAGLAHEFNNPASAVKRGAVELDQRLASLERVAFELRGVELDEARIALIGRLAKTPHAILDETAMQRARRERALEDALTARGAAQPWELAPTLAAMQWDVAALDELVAAFPPAALPIVVRWIDATASSRALAKDVAEAATRISDLVNAVRSHSHLGEAPIQEVDLHDGLDSTLRLLRHQLGTVTVRREYAADLPRVDAWVSELNQVWTNLVDNALYAMNGSGELVVSTARLDADHVVVTITDTGPGIPAEIQSQVWKPFFTTKPVGAGTGLGLHLSYNVVVYRHRGRIELESRPGRTCFRVILPLRRTHEVTR